MRQKTKTSRKMCIAPCHRAFQVALSLSLLYLAMAAPAFAQQYCGPTAPVTGTGDVEGGGGINVVSIEGATAPNDQVLVS